jgi:hypothetical protein
MDSFEEGVLSGKSKNCFVRFDSTSEPAVLDIYFPKTADEDRWELRDILNDKIVAKKEWIDSGLRIFLAKTLFSPLKDMQSLIAKITTHFEQKYPGDAFLRFKSYSCGHLAQVVLIHINDNIVLKYNEELRTDFTKNFCKVIFSEATKKCNKVYINTYEMGTLELKNGLIEMHRWENEDEAQAASYLSKRYTQRLLNGILDDPGARKVMLEIIRESMADKQIEKEDLDYFNAALDVVGLMGSQ